MPLARYFLYVGGVLLALLFISDAYLPKLPVAHEAAANAPLIRIDSDQKWPERIVYDTNLPTIVPAQIANTDASVAGPTAIADVAAKVPAREAFAQLQPSDAKQLQPSDSKKQDVKRPRQRKIAKRRAPPIILVARRPQFGWFGNVIW